jgi:hypothetical protein
MNFDFKRMLKFEINVGSKEKQMRIYIYWLRVLLIKRVGWARDLCSFAQRSCYSSTVDFSMPA